jgi:general stress protein 26
VPTDGSGGERLPWSLAFERPSAARSYWICTTRADGRPHASPVGSPWLEDAVWFSTSRSSVKAQNLARGPAVTMHLDSGDEVVLLEGDVEEPDDAATLTRFADAYEAKYGLPARPRR